ncbi:unnamed protein product [Schistocephalus solidus]|uniref:Uncharacterized protein n=1 Tax=Schistocephalus solidus TaxID=70667 RepID=A0A183T533_SCHSO|nr:unnamed protein product [Schistocephalus solidus]
MLLFQTNPNNMTLKTTGCFVSLCARSYFRPSLELNRLEQLHKKRPMASKSLALPTATGESSGKSQSRAPKPTTKPPALSPRKTSIIELSPTGRSQKTTSSPPNIDSAKLSKQGASESLIEVSAVPTVEAQPTPPSIQTSSSAADLIGLHVGPSLLPPGPALGTSASSPSVGASCDSAADGQSRPTKESILALYAKSPPMLGAVCPPVKRLADTGSPSFGVPSPANPQRQPQQSNLNWFSTGSSTPTAVPASDDLSFSSLQAAGPVPGQTFATNWGSTTSPNVSDSLAAPMRWPAVSGQPQQQPATAAAAAATFFGHNPSQPAAAANCGLQRTAWAAPQDYLAQDAQGNLSCYPNAFLGKGLLLFVHYDDRTVWWIVRVPSAYYIIRFKTNWLECKFKAASASNQGSDAKETEDEETISVPPLSSDVYLFGPALSSNPRPLLWAGV